MSIVKLIIGHIENYINNGHADNASKTLPNVGSKVGIVSAPPIASNIGDGVGGNAGGHEFEPHSVDRPTSCDACGRAAFGDGLAACRLCSSLCHTECAGTIEVACHRGGCGGGGGGGDSSVNDDVEEDLAAFVTAKEILLDRAYTLSSLDSRSINRAGVRILTPQGPPSQGGGGGADASFYAAWTPEKLTVHLYLLSQRLPGQEFRPLHQHQHHLHLMQPQASQQPRFRGSLRVYVNLLRPVHSDKPAATFFLPRGHTCLLHGLAGDTGSDAVVWQLLAKLRIKDPAHKFGLYLHTVRGESTVEVRCLSPSEKPLEMLLSWTTLPAAEMRNAFEMRRFVLQECDTSTVDWDAFSIPELHNFLQILEFEEDLHARNIRIKFDALRQCLLQRIADVERGLLREESEA